MTPQEAISSGEDHCQNLHVSRFSNASRSTTASVTSRESAMSPGSLDQQSTQPSTMNEPAQEMKNSHCGSNLFPEPDDQDDSDREAEARRLTLQQKERVMLLERRSSVVIRTNGSTSSSTKSANSSCNSSSSTSSSSSSGKRTERNRTRRKNYPEQDDIPPDINNQNPFDELQAEDQDEEVLLSWHRLPRKQGDLLVERVLSAGAWLGHQKLRRMILRSGENDFQHHVWVLKMKNLDKSGRTYEVPAHFIGTTFEAYRNYFRSYYVPLYQAALEYAGLSSAYVISDAEEWGLDPAFLVPKNKSSGRRSQQQNPLHAATQKLNASTCAASSDSPQTTVRDGVIFLDCPFLVTPIVVDLNARNCMYLQAPQYFTEPFMAIPVEVEDHYPAAHIETKADFFKMLEKIPCLFGEHRGVEILEAL
ncbi:unnamed protein product [Amoebophrya sp. A120]|nr:unnamed protein product [Amoebophrya sp. A120]|eukprot:GSA120T00017846001.1